MDSTELERIVFKMKRTVESTEIGIPESIKFQSQYIQLKVKNYNKGNKQMKLLQMIDVTSYILYTEFKAKNQFISLINACVSHELRNPLNSIISKNIEKSALYLNLQIKLKQMDTNTQETDVFKECFKILDELVEGKKVQQNSAELMNFIIQDLLDFAQIKGNKFRKNHHVFNIKESVEKVMSMQRQKANDKDLEFHAEFLNIGTEEEGLESPMICCDEHRIMQVLLGIQANALKFTQNGKVQTNIEIIKDEGTDKKFLKISVIDTGIGIPKENQDKLFKLFGFVQDDQHLNVNGIGLGLMISQ